MQSWLHGHFHVKATVLYDRPSQLFKSSTIVTNNKYDETNDNNIDMQRPLMQQRYDLLSRLGFTDDKLFPHLKISQPSRETNDSVDIATATSSPKLLVSATSWTADEDFSVLLDALQELERCMCLQDTASSSSHTATTAPTAGTALRLLVVVTGKGPMKAAFEARVKELADMVTT